jgi:hypothetical protein
MRNFLAKTTLVLFMVTISNASAHAGGWSGDDSSILRAHLNQGKTLTKIWSLINDR